jgi:16S rRNA pseudouridine516 synthase
MTKSALATRIDTHHIILTIFEWRYHQIKKMLLSLNNKVVWLHRAAIGSLMLRSLPVGEFTQLSNEQTTSMFEVDYEQIHNNLLK